MATEILVIGAGPGGCVSATEFARAGHSVLMVEEGPYLPLSATPHFSCAEMLQKYRGAGVGVAVGRHKLAWVEGRCVGGGSEVNRGLYHRTPPEVLDRWARDFGVDHIGADDLAPHFEACESIAKVEHVPTRASAASRRMALGAQVMDWEVVEARRLYRYEPEGRPGIRQSMTETFVKSFLELGGEIMPSVRIRKIEPRAGGWVAKGDCSNEVGASTRIVIRADAVVVACGAVQTPALLRRSGIRHNVGNSLRFHPMVKIVAEFDHDIHHPGDFDPVHQIREFEPRLGMGCSVAPPPMLGLALASRPNHWQLVEQRARRMGIYYVQSAGGVASVRNLAGFSEPLVRVRFTADELATLGQGLGRLSEVMFAAGAVRIYPCIAGYPMLSGPGDIGKLPQTLRPADGAMTSVHVFSSCPMGENEARTATDSFGRVHGAARLYVADASLLCTPTVANPQGTVMAVAHRNATAAIERDFRSS